MGRTTEIVTAFLFLQIFKQTLGKRIWQKQCFEVFTRWNKLLQFCL